MKAKMSKPKLYLHVQRATHFLEWERQYFNKYFDIVDSPSNKTILFAFGPDALSSGSLLPARFRIAMLFPGFGLNPYHDLAHRRDMQRIIEDRYHLIFANPGPIAEAFPKLPTLRLCPFSINTDLIKFRNYKKSINSLLHASADYPQKDWQRSYEVMRLTELRCEVYPPRQQSVQDILWRKLRIGLHISFFRRPAPPFLHKNYVSHDKIIEKYNQYDGFVHIAAETPPFVDGKYTATLLEAGLSGCILFWHDTLGLGNDFETIFSLPADPEAAASAILDIRKNIDVEAHSRRTVDEIFDRVNPDKIMRTRFSAIRELLE